MSAKIEHITPIIELMSSIVETTQMSLDEQVEYCATLAMVFDLTAKSLKDIVENGENEDDIPND